MKSSTCPDRITRRPHLGFRQVEISQPRYKLQQIDTSGRGRGWHGNRDTGAGRLEQKLEDDYLLWWDVPSAPSRGCSVLPPAPATARSSQRNFFDPLVYEQIEIIFNIDKVID